MVLLPTHVPPEKREEWKKGPRISKSDMINANGFERMNGVMDQKTSSSVTPKDTMTFGKHKGKKIKDVMEEDPGYISWAEQNVPRFAQQLAALK